MSFLTPAFLFGALAAARSRGRRRPACAAAVVFRGAPPAADELY